MVKTIHIKRGLDIPLSGVATEKKRKGLYSDYIAIQPADFLGISPKLLVKEGDVILAGDPIFADKHRPQLQIASPVSGKNVSK